MNLDSLARPDLYEDEMEKLRQRSLRRGRPEALTQEGFYLGSAGDRSRRLARLIAKTVASGRYRFGPVQRRRALVDGKWRALYRARPTDTIVLGVLARVLADRIDPFLSPRVYSYRAGGSPWKAIGDLAEYIHQHRAERPDRRQRGLYVIRRDIRAYGDSIPAGPGSALWILLREAIARDGEAVAEEFVDWLAGGLRPELREGEGALSRPVAGIPTGSPIQPLICNLYLTPVDRMAESVAGGFYARFGDDMLFAHAEAAVARETASRIDEGVRGLGLELKESLRGVLYFTAPGRPSPDWPESRPASFVEYLGCRIGFGGPVGLKRERARRLIQAMRRRLRQTDRLLSDEPFEARAAALCEAASRALDPDCLAADRAAAPLRFVVDDRAQLKQLDYLIALEVAALLSGRRGARAFRRARYRSLRRDFGLTSLVRERNRRAAGRGKA
jgi:hypothetical protein